MFGEPSFPNSPSSQQQAPEVTGDHVDGDSIYLSIAKVDDRAGNDGPSAHKQVAYAPVASDVRAPGVSTHSLPSLKMLGIRNRSLTCSEAHNDVIDALLYNNRDKSYRQINDELLCLWDSQYSDPPWHQWYKIILDIGGIIFQNQELRLISFFFEFIYLSNETIDYKSTTSFIHQKWTNFIRIFTRNGEIDKDIRRQKRIEWFNRVRGKMVWIHRESMLALKKCIISRGMKCVMCKSTTPYIHNDGASDQCIVEILNNHQDLRINYKMLEDHIQANRAAVLGKRKLKLIDGAPLLPCVEPRQSTIDRPSMKYSNFYSEFYNEPTVASIQDVETPSNNVSQSKVKMFRERNRIKFKNEEYDRVIRENEELVAENKALAERVKELIAKQEDITQLYFDSLAAVKEYRTAEAKCMIEKINRTCEVSIYSAYATRFEEMNELLLRYYGYNGAGYEYTTSHEVLGEVIKSNQEHKRHIENNNDKRHKSCK